MFSTPIYLVNIDEVLNDETGERTKAITHEQLVYADKQEVGLNEFYSSQSIHVDITGVYEIPKHMYNNERFILSEDRLHQHEIYRVAKGRNLSLVRLVLKKCKLTDLIEGVTNG